MESVQIYRWDIYRLNQAGAKAQVVLSPDPLLAAGGDVVCCPVIDEQASTFTVGINLPDEDSLRYAAIPHLQTLPQKKLGAKVGRLSHDEIEKVELALREFFMLF